MPGRQSTGPLRQSKPRPRRKTQKRSLNALAIAEQTIPDKPRLKRSRLGEAEQSLQKRRRDVPEEDGSGNEVDRRSKKFRAGDVDRLGNEVEGGSDGSGNEWVTGQVDDDDDSSLDSDEAMGKSDDERFEGFTFRGSSSTKRSNKKKRVSEHAADDQGINLKEGDEAEVDEGEESDEFAENAVDLATMLDDNDGATEESDFTSEDSDDDRKSALSLSDLEDDTMDAGKLSALRTMISSMGYGSQANGSTREAFDVAQEAATPSEFGINSKQKLTIADLLPTVTDPKIRKSLRLLAGTDKKPVSAGKGVPGKLDVPLAKRQQDRLDRAAAYEKSKETLNRWIDTVKHNRRAEHLVFPLPNPDAQSAKNTKTLLPTFDSKPFNDLEAAIQNILVESGMAPAKGKSPDDQIQALEELAMNKMSIEEVQARRAELRKARELLFREEIRAKRINKIKSKSYRRVHRRERERNALREQEALVAAGVEPSEDEQERMDRQRAEERMGARHRESKWAKAVKGIGRAAWDEDARIGVTEMARREEELRRRILGKNVQDHESLGGETESSSDGESDEEAQSGKIQDRLDRLRAKSGTEKTGNRLSDMAFMQRAEAARKARNDEAVEKLSRELAGEDTPEGSEGEVPGRRKYGPQTNARTPEVRELPNRSEFGERSDSDDEGAREVMTQDVEITVDKPTGSSDRSKHIGIRNGLSKSRPQPEEGEPISNPWLVAPTRSSKSHKTTPDTSVLISTAPEAPAPSTSASIKTPSQPSHTTLPDDTSDDDDDDDGADSFAGFSDPESPPPTLSRNQQLIAQAFAGDAVVSSFAREKAADAQLERSPSPTDNHLPGWGAWTGAGLSKRDRAERRSRNAHLETVRAKEKEKEKEKKKKKKADAPRKDARLERVAISEKRVPKTAKYLASGLPFPFETRAQYERSLRVPVGPEWTTKETFQAGTKPRVLVGGGVIAAMERPIV